MADCRLPNVDELEQGVRTETYLKHRDWLVALENLLNAYIAVFRESGPFYPSEENRREKVWLLLTARSFNSMRWAYELVRTGYYSQAMLLTRSVFEDWLVCMDAIGHDQTVDAISSLWVADPQGSPAWLDNRLLKNFSYGGKAMTIRSRAYMAPLAHSLTQPTGRLPLR